MDSRDWGTHEFGPSDVLEIFKTLALLWGTYKCVKEISTAAGGLKIELSDPMVVRMWTERLVDAGVPQKLAEKIAEKYWREFLENMRQESE